MQYVSIGWYFLVDSSCGANVQSQQLSIMYLSGFTRVTPTCLR